MTTYHSFCSLTDNTSFLERLQIDAELQAMLNETFNISFAYADSETCSDLGIQVVNGKLMVGEVSQPTFTLSASTGVWAKYFVKQQELG